LLAYGQNLNQKFTSFSLQSTKMKRSFSLYTVLNFLKVREVIGDGAHAVVNLVPNPKVASEALTYLRKKGTLVMVGLPSTAIEIDPILTIAGLITIRGSLIGTRADLAVRMPDEHKFLVP
jgi:D-arabinose 1-dehydrogenase-like Zn-dependent alcohol dehydrogenase